MATPHVALLIETAREYGRGLLRGITRYHREHGPWSFTFEPYGLREPPPRWLRTWRGDGLLVRINDAEMADAIRRLGLPAIDLRGALGNLGLQRLGVDNTAIARLGIDHFLDRGFRHFGFCGTPPGEYLYHDARRDAFRRMVEEQGLSCHVFDDHDQGGAADWDDDRRRLEAWLRDLPRPIGIMTCHDDRGLQVLGACKAARISVPDEVAILGVENDEFLCNLATPPLSSIELNPDRIGYEAARLLDLLLKRETPPRPLIELPPRGVVTRQSTDVMAIADPYVVQAIRLIREHSCRGASVEEIVREVPLSRSALFRRFTRELGRSPKQEIVRVRMEKARELLAETDLSVSAISERVGYSEAKYFIEVFRESTRHTPLQYRRKVVLAKSSFA